MNEPARPAELRWTIGHTISSYGTAHDLIDGPFIGRIEVMPVSQLERAVCPEITDVELDAAWAAWVEHWVTEDGRSAMRSALVAFLSARGAVAR